MISIRLKTAVFASLLVTVLSMSALMPAAHADIKAGSVDVSSGCVATFNGIRSNFNDTVTTGQSYSLPVMNNSYSVTETVSGPGIASGTTISPNNKASAVGSNPKTISFSGVTSQIIVTFTPVPSNDSGFASPNNCPIGSPPTAVTLTITPVAAPVPSTPATTPNDTTSDGSTSQPTLTAGPTGIKTAPATTMIDPDSFRSTSGDHSASSLEPASNRKNYKPSIVSFSLAAILLVGLIGWQGGILHRLLKRKTE